LNVLIIDSSKAIYSCTAHHKKTGEIISPVFHYH